jgi:hypothetical protein
VSIAIIDAAVIVVRGCLLPLIVCRGFYFVGDEFESSTF